jgi:hypothetical protein
LPSEYPKDCDALDGLVDSLDSPPQTVQSPTLLSREENDTNIHTGIHRPTVSIERIK